MSIKQIIFDAVKVLETLKIHGSEARLLVQVAELLKQAFDGTEQSEKTCEGLQCEIADLKTKVKELEEKLSKPVEVQEVS